MIRQLEIIGEASRNLSDEFREDNPEIPWSQIIGMRNRIVHAYFNVDLEITWGIVTMDLPILKEYLITLLEEKRGK
ncbi:MAG TPA: HepT-like ribonuclease domain-containing protein [Anaerolineales bacterium]|nr:HepT-like ribonuclease domain-containing protein [Anaerolineales bacterium]